jgi:hypothetical protein
VYKQLFLRSPNVLPALTEELYRERVGLFFEGILSAVISRDDMVRDVAAQFLRIFPLEQARNWIIDTFADDESVSWRRGIESSIDAHLREIAGDRRSAYSSFRLWCSTVTKTWQAERANRASSLWSNEDTAAKSQFAILNPES